MRAGYMQMQFETMNLGGKLRKVCTEDQET